jgi:hypothetical protein
VQIHISVGGRCKVIAQLQTIMVKTIPFIASYPVKIDQNFMHAGKLNT